MRPPPTVYVATSIVSYLAALPSRQLVTAAHQQLTAEWWAVRRHRYRHVTSEAVRREAARGGVTLAVRRLALLDGGWNGLV